MGFKRDPQSNQYDAGDGFNYSVWTANTELTLANVPWDAAYKDVVHFDSTDDLNMYLDGRGDSTNISDVMYARIDEPIIIDMPFAVANQYNYIRAFNPAQPVPGGDIAKYYYYFIVGMVHDAPNTTRIIVQLDVWQTWIRQIQFGMAYINRGHIGVANQNKGNNYGRDYLTIPDGLDTGSDYVNVTSRRRNLLDTSGTFKDYNVLAFSTVDLSAPPYLDPPTNSKPNNPTARGTIFGNLISGAMGFVWTSPIDFLNFMGKYSQYPWMTSGIISITLIPSVAALGYTFQSGKDADTGAYKLVGAPSFNRRLFPNWRESDDVMSYIPDRYKVFKEKLLTAPYCMLELTAQGGSALVMKPELWNSAHASVMETSSFMPPNQRIVYYPEGYNGRNYGDGWADNQAVPADNVYLQDGDNLDMALIISSFPTIPIVNNGQLEYLAQNAHSIAAQYQSLDYSQTKALRGNQVGAENTTVGMNAGMSGTANSVAGDMNQLAIQQQLQAQTAMFNLLGGIGAGGAGGAAGGPVGMGAGAATAAGGGLANLATLNMQQDAANRAYNARTNTAYGAAKISYGAAGQVRDNNLAYGNWAARGDYENARRLMDGKIQDTRMIQPGVSSGFGGDAYLFNTRQMYLTFKIKMVDQASMARAGEFWLRYGYPVGRPSRIPNDLRVMTKFSYWQLTECYILNAAMPESHKQTVRGVLEKGVTVWTNAADIGLIDFADNEPLDGIVIGGYTPPEWTPEPPPTPPVTPKRKQKKMLVYTTVDGTSIWALAGSAGAGVPANFLTTRDAVLAGAWMDACGVTEAVALDTTTFYDYQAQYQAQPNVLANAVQPFYTTTAP